MPILVPEHCPNKLAGVCRRILWGYDIEPRVRQGTVLALEWFIIDNEFVDDE